MSPERVHVIVADEQARSPELRAGLDAVCSELACTPRLALASDALDSLPRSIAPIVGARARVIVVGNDAIVNRAVTELMSVDASIRPSLGVVPLGTPSSIAANLGLSSNVAQALTDAITGAPRAVDVGRWGPRWFLDVVCGGAVGELGIIDESPRRVVAGLTHAVAGVMGLPALRPLNLQLRGASFVWAGSIYALAVGNMRTNAAGFAACPDASSGDGELEVTVVPANLDLVDVVELINARSVAGVAGVRRFRSPWIDVRARSRLYFDIAGELRSCVRARFDVERDALSLILPRR